MIKCSTTSKDDSLKTKPLSSMTSNSISVFGTPSSKTKGLFPLFHQMGTLSFFPTESKFRWNPSSRWKLLSKRRGTLNWSISWKQSPISKQKAQQIMLKSLFLYLMMPKTLVSKLPSAGMNINQRNRQWYGIWKLSQDKENISLISPWNYPQLSVLIEKDLWDSLFWLSSISHILLLVASKWDISRLLIKADTSLCLGSVISLKMETIK